MRLFLLLLVVTAFNVQAQDIWSAEELNAFGQELSGRVQPNNMALMPNIINEEGYFAHLLFREAGPGFSEMHEASSDLYFIISGSASLVTGGTMVDPTENATGEFRGTGITGGTSRAIARGDIVHIPPGIPHHVIVGDGEDITYFLFKPR